MVLKARPGKNGDNSKNLIFNIEDYEFREFANKNRPYDNQVRVQEYTIPPMQDVAVKNKGALNDIIKAERGHADNNSFTISPIVKEHRGMRDQEIQEYNKKIQDEVDRREKEIRQEWEVMGFAEGKKLGYAEVLKNSLKDAQEQTFLFQGILEEIMNVKNDIIRTQKEQILELVKALTKWVILKEVREDGNFIQRLVEKLILELGTRDNLLIKINKHHFQSMPHLMEVLEKRLGMLRNVRVEIDHDQERPGVIIESPNGIIDGSFEAQMEGLDKLFIHVLDHDNEPK